MDTERAKAELANVKGIIEYAVFLGEISDASLSTLEFSIELISRFIERENSLEGANEVKKIERLMLVLVNKTDLSYIRYDKSRNHLERLMAAIEKEQTQEQ